MDLTVVWWVLAGLIVIAGLAGTVLPALPGVPMVFAGLLLAAWASNFEPAGAGTIAVVLGIMASVVMAFFAILWYPAKRLIRARKATRKAAETAKSDRADG